MPHFFVFFEEMQGLAPKLLIDHFYVFFRFWIVNCGKFQLASPKSPQISLSICRFDGWLQASNHWRFDGWWFQASSHCACREACHELGIDWIRKVWKTSLKLIACLYRPGPQKGRWIIFQWKSGKFCCSFQGGFVVFVVRTSLDGNPVTTLKFHSYPIINPAGLVLLHAFRIWKLSDISILYLCISP